MARSAIDFQRLLAGERVAIARAISEVENGEASARTLLREIFPRTGRCYRIGITGPPGAGKSTIANKLAQHYRALGLQVGIIAVDPTSPFTGGALLGDRVRMTDVELDEGVFIRSMASRGSLGGLSKKAVEAADVLDASGKEIVIMETVGVGQSELDIASAADSTVVVLVPESGDSIQAMKAGLMEIADFFVLNKADRAGAEQAAMSIQMILHFRSSLGWLPSVIKTVASAGSGISDIAGEIARHRQYQEASGSLASKRKARLERRVRDLVSDKLRGDFWTKERQELLDERIGEVARERSSPYDIADELLAHFHSR
ncbi:MAG TPA: methylmalonyl Co-A mutase-associated GTPase MeaB [Bacteroidota bacterium]|nr:methylmalonyl Co-A mutase-associated GTPase MeaB [Bacteroidota bacterium]